MRFSEWLNERLTKTGMSARELAERCRLSRALVYYYLSGKRMPTEANAKKMAGELGAELTAQQLADFTRKSGRPSTKVKQEEP